MTQKQDRRVEIKKQIILLTVIATVLLTGCTGKAAAPPDDQQQAQEQAGGGVQTSAATIGQYAINPSFVITMPRSGLAYGGLYQLIAGEQGLINTVNACERTGTPLSTCVDEQLARMTSAGTMVWHQGGCTDEERAVTTLAEQYDACLTAESNGCLCTILLQHEEPLEEDRFIIITKRSYTEGEFEEGEQQGNDMLSQVIPQAVSWIDGEPAFGQQERLDIVFPKGSNEQGNRFYILFYKHDDGLYFISDEEAEGNEELIAAIPQCEVQLRTVKFCVEEPANILILDEEGNIRESIQYKFAIAFPDITPPPPIKNLIIRDTPVRENSVMLQWDKSEEQDLDSFFIFSRDAVSSSDVWTKDTALLITELGPRMVKTKDAVLIRDALDAAKLEQGCTFDYTTTSCKYFLESGESMALAPETLYLFGASHEQQDQPGQQYVYILDQIPDDIAHMFTIVANDVFGNIINNKDEGQKALLKQGASADDLPPNLVTEVATEPVEIIEGESVKRYLRVHWRVPETNIDGSIADDVDSFVILYQHDRGTTRKAAKASDACVMDECSILLLYISDGTVQVGALDEKGNVDWRWQEKAVKMVVE